MNFLTFQVFQTAGDSGGKQFSNQISKYLKRKKIAHQKQENIILDELPPSYLRYSVSERVDERLVGYWTSIWQVQKNEPKRGKNWKAIGRFTLN